MMRNAKASVAVGNSLRCCVVGIQQGYRGGNQWLFRFAGYPALYLL